MREISDDLSPVERKVLDDVDQHGVHIVHVPKDDEGPGFSFTIGLWHHFEQAEVIAFGMPKKVAHELLNVVADEADDGKRFQHGERHEGLLVNYPVRFVEVPKSRFGEYLGLLLWAYDGSDFPCVQLVWPSKDQRWPWDDGVSAGFQRSQPILGPRDA